MSFVYSEQHAWQNDKAVQQILVFNNKFAKEEYRRVRDKALSEFIAKEIIAHIKEREVTPQYIATCRMKFLETYDENNTGASFKLRAVMNSKHGWNPMVRCGITGVILVESMTPLASTTASLLKAQELLKGYLRDFADEELYRG